MLVQVGGAENFATFRALEVSVLVHRPDMLPQVVPAGTGFTILTNCFSV